MRRNCVGLAGREDLQAVNALRLETYNATPEFRLLRPDLLAWHAADFILHRAWWLGRHGPAGSDHPVQGGWLRRPR